MRAVTRDFDATAGAGQRVERTVGECLLAARLAHLVECLLGVPRDLLGDDNGGNATL